MNPRFIIQGKHWSILNFHEPLYKLFAPDRQTNYAIQFSQELQTVQEIYDDYNTTPCVDRQVK